MVVPEDVRMQIEALARDMVRLEMETRSAMHKQQWSRVGDLDEERQQVQAHRSELLRELWFAKRRLLV